MILTIKKPLVEAIGKKKFTAFGLSEDSWAWRGHADINLVRLKRDQLDKLVALLEGQKATQRSAITALKDIAMWRAAAEGDIKGVKPRTVAQFYSLCTKFICLAPSQRVFQKEGDVWLCYHVNTVEYTPKAQDREGHIRPAYVEIELIWEEFGGTHKDDIIFYIDDVRALTIPTALARKNLLIETPELRAGYLATRAKFADIVERIGEQYLAVGTGTDNMDGNPERRSNNTIQLVRNGEPTRVVVDVFYENDENDETDRRERSVHVHTWFWRNVEHRKFAAEDSDDDDDDKEDAPDENDEEIPEIEVPIHPNVAVFDLTKHLRLRVHVDNLTKYEYDTKLADKLILPEELKALVTMLIEHKDGGFKDIVKGKAGGAVVLLAGAPGVGKTLTAEVYAEAESRALYSVQCSQLGTEPDDLEGELLKIFERARRWRAVLLLDEADVYVHERGHDLQQNAIVGVFLRVLEYQDSVLFLTTNRPENVDDAIASRCVARLSYKLPTQDEQRKIWRVLANGAGTILSDETINKIVADNPKLTGRDVKNLLKLGMLVSRRDKKLITPEVIEFVKRFKPTGDTE